MSEEPRQHPLVSFLELHSDDRAMLAELRRGLGRNPGEAAGMFPYVLPYVSNPRQEGDLFLIASLFALHPLSAKSGNLGDHLRAYAQEVGDDTSTTRRLIQLLSLRRPALDSPLRQHISMLKAKDIAVNWHQLIFDVQYWSHDDHFVQKKWASAYWRSPSQSPAKKQN